MKYVFLNFTKVPCTWVCDDIVLNFREFVPTQEVLYNHRINLEKMFDKIKETSELKNGKY